MCTSNIYKISIYIYNINIFLDMRNSLIINTILGKPPKLVNTTYLLVAKKIKEINLP